MGLLFLRLQEEEEKAEAERNVKRYKDKRVLAGQDRGRVGRGHSGCRQGKGGEGAERGKSRGGGGCIGIA